MTEKQEAHIPTIVGRVSSSDDQMSPNRDGALVLEAEPEHMTRAAWLGCLALLLAESAALQPLMLSSVSKKIDDRIGPVPYYNWIMIGTSIAQTIAYAITGGLSDIFGRPAFLMGGAALLIVGLIMALVAKSMPLMIAAMVVQGLGSGIQQLAVACIGEIVPRRYRGWAQAAMDLTFLPWNVFGPLIALSVIKHYSLGYKICFIIGLVLNGLSIICIFFLYKPQRKPLPYGRTKAQQLAKVDWIGVFLYTASLVLILVALSLGGTDVPYKKPGFYLTLTVGFLTLVALFLWEWKGAAEPFFVRTLFNGRKRYIPLCFVLIFVSGMTMYTNAAFWPQQLQGMYYTDEEKIGVAAMTSGGFMALGGFVGGFGLGKAWWLESKYMLSFSALLKIGADIMLTRATPETVGLAIGGTALGAFSMGVLAIACYTVVQLTCEEKDLGLATLLTQSLRSAGGSTALAIYSNYIQSTMQTKVTVLVLPYIGQYMAGLKDVVKFFTLMSTGQFEQAKQLPGSSDKLVQITHDRLGWVWTAAFKKIYTTSIGFAAVAFVTALFVGNIRHLMTDDIVVHMENDSHVHGDKYLTMEQHIQRQHERLQAEKRV